MEKCLHGIRKSTTFAADFRNKHQFNHLKTITIMGKRVHVVKQQEKYGNSEYFNWKYNEFADLLGQLGCEAASMDEYNMERFEVETDKFQRAINVLKEYKGGKTSFDNDIDIDGIDAYLDELGGIDNVIEAMEAFYEQRDKDSGWMIFVAW
jgi:hypothetical protein